MTKTFFFYDLETSGLDARNDRIMQFAGQRTNEAFKPIGEPYNCLIKLNDDTLPSPDAVMVTGITPQSTQADGYTEAEFAKLLIDEIFTEDTTVVGFNNIRFDDEFIRHLLWRNFYDPYEWAWRDGRSRWDLLDVVRMARALRPEGINWPVVNGVPTNKLELLSKENNLQHDKAHDALSDVEALIDVTRLLATKQPQLFTYLLKMRSKDELKKLINLDQKQPFVYSSGRYDSRYNKTTVAFPLTAAPHGNVLVYDLRHDPSQLVNLSKKELAARLGASWQERQDPSFVPIPVKQLQYNRAPAVAPLSVLEAHDGWKNIELDATTIMRHMKLLLSAPQFAERIREITEERPAFAKQTDAEGQLYDGFLNDNDKRLCTEVTSRSTTDLADFHPNWNDERLTPLLLRYKARNFPNALSQDEQLEWEVWRSQHLQQALPSFIGALDRLAKAGADEFLLSELKLWAEGIAPNEQ